MKSSFAKRLLLAANAYCGPSNSDIPAGISPTKMPNQKLSYRCIAVGQCCIAASYALHRLKYLADGKQEGLLAGIQISDWARAE
jgi:hypothetical protein